jgi:hypothetical protein
VLGYAAAQGGSGERDDETAAATSGFGEAEEAVNGAGVEAPQAMVARTMGASAKRRPGIQGRHRSSVSFATPAAATTARRVGAP